MSKVTNRFNIDNLKAIVEIIRDRIKGQKNSDLAELVSIGARTNIQRDESHHHKQDKSKKGEEDEEEEDDDDDDDDEDDNEPVSKFSSFSQHQGDEDEEEEEEEPQQKSTSEFGTSSEFVNTKTEISDDDEY